MAALFSLMKGQCEGYKNAQVIGQLNGQANVPVNGHTNGQTNGHSSKVVLSNGQNGAPPPAENDFLRQVVDLVLDECQIVGDRDTVKERNPELVHFLQPKQLEKELKLRIRKQGTSDQELLELCRKTIKYSVKTSHPYFYNQLYAGIDEYGLAGSWLTDALNTSQATYEISPVFTVMERAAMKYFGSLIGWPDDRTDGIFSPGGSLANIYAIVLARHRMFPDCKRTGVRAIGQVVMFTSEASHYSYVKGFIWLGMGSESVIKVKTDAKGRMDPVALDEAIVASLADGKIPLMVGCTAGTTVLGAFDPLQDIGVLCRRYKLWMHVDGALGGTVLFSRKHRHLLDGVKMADSMTWNLHKLAGVPLQCSAFLTSHPSLLFEANSLNAEYLFQSDKYYDASYDSGDKSIQCGRKVDSLKLWLALAASGEDKLESLVDNIFDVVSYAVDSIRKRPGFELVLPEMESNNVCFWYVPTKIRSRNGTRVADIPQLGKVCPLVKGLMMERGDLMVNYQPLTSKGLPNFFRLVLTCVPKSTRADMDWFLDQIEMLGEQIEF